MTYIINDLSIEGQFANIYDFKIAIDRVMKMRKMIERSGHYLHCHRNLSSARATDKYIFQQAVNNLDNNRRRALMSWLTKDGPFWEDIRLHSEDDYLECSGNVVTNSGVGEAAFLCFQGPGGNLVSITPSSWEYTPIFVDLHKDDGSDHSIEVPNYWEPDILGSSLDKISVVYNSWNDLIKDVTLRCNSLIFLPNSFEPLSRYPFMRSQAHHIFERLQKLNDLKNCFDGAGNRTTRGHEIIRNHFTGGRAWFSDSSDSEKSKFGKELTFPHPDRKGENLFCPWHGKVSSHHVPIRIHFSWPIRADEPLYVVYVGPKLTMD